MGIKKQLILPCTISVIGHVVAIALVIGCATARGCFTPKKPMEIVEFTIAVDPYEEPEQPDPPKDEPKLKPPSPAPEPEDIPAVAPKKKSKPKPPPEKPLPKKKPRPKIVKGKRYERTQKVVKTNIQPKTKTMSEKEIKKWLNGRTPVTVGERTSLPDNERDWNASLIKKELYRAWRQPSHETAGRRIALVAISLGRGGALSNPRVTSSSGSKTFDESALDAVRAVSRIPELSNAFIRDIPEVVIEFKLD